LDGLVALEGKQVIGLVGDDFIGDLDLAAHGVVLTSAPSESTIASRHRHALVLIIGAIIYGHDQLELRGKALSEA
jgi:hypothetical protein